MKIAFLLGEFPIISETFIVSQITTLLDLGHEVEIFALRRSKDNKIHEDVKKYNLIEKTHFINVPENKAIKLIKAFYLLFINFYKNPINLLKSFNFIKYGKFAFSLNLFYTGIAFYNYMNYFDIIHAHFGQRGVIGIYLKEMGAKGRLATTFYGGDVNEKYKNGYKYLFKKGNLFIVNNNFKKNKLIELGCYPKKIVVIPTGVFLEKFIFSRKKIKKNEKIKILSIGRLVEKKGIKYAILAIADIVKNYKKIEYKIVGDGILRVQLEGLVKRLNLEKYVRFLGYCTQEEYIKLYKNSHIFLSPCVTASNGDSDQSLVNQEAQAMGLPVISTLHNGIPEGVLDKRSGFLVPEKDYKAIAEKLDYLIKNPQKWSEMGRAGSNFIKNRYNQKELSLKLIGLYKSCLRNI